MDITFPLQTFSVKSVLGDRWHLLLLEGELDIAEAPWMDAAIDACTDGLPVIIDLTSLTFIDSAGVRALLRERQGARPSALVRTPESIVGRVLDIMMVGNAIPLYDDLADAIRQLDAGVVEE